MKLGVLTCMFGDRSLEETLKYLAPLGVQMVEIGSGGVLGKSHCNPAELLASPTKLQNFKDTLEKYNIGISGFSCHENLVHPNKALADQFYTDFKETVLLAEKLGVECVMNFSGCPGDGPNAIYPNWVVQPWPDDFSKLLKWQWDEVLIPFWKEAGKFASEHGVKICIEQHPGFCVYNPETMLKLRNAVGDVIGCNFDPSNLFWQDIDIPTAIRELGPAIYHFHAKDSIVQMFNVRKNGRLDAKNYSDEANRSWLFRTVGYAHDTLVWKDIMSTLVSVGYDHVISIEHEDTLMTANEGLEKAIDFLKSVMIFEKASGLWWANVDLRD